MPMAQVAGVTQADLTALAASDLAVYIRAFMPTFRLTRHHRVILEKLEAIEAGKLSRLIVCLPPQHGKSIVCSAFFPAWYLGKDPRRKVILASHTQELAEEFGRKIRNLLADEHHALIFPECKLSEDSQAAHRFSTTLDGKFFACGRGGSPAGRGASLIVVDDPLKDFSEAASEPIRKELHEWYGSTMLSRLSARGAIVVIATRWHEDDLAGRLIQGNVGREWDVLSLPAIAEEDDPLGRPVGAALAPELFPLEVLEQRKASMEMSSALWASLYQQRPAPIEGAVFKLDWFRRYTDVPHFSRIVIAADTAFSSRTSADFSAAVVIGEAATGYYVLDVWRARAEFPELKAHLVQMAARWKPHALLVEKSASGQSIIQEFQRETRLTVLPVTADKDKLTRATSVTPMCEAGRVFLPAKAPWLDDFVQEVTTFPAGRHDDQVDALVHGLSWLRGGAASSPGTWQCEIGGGRGGRARWSGY